MEAQLYIAQSNIMNTPIAALLLGSFEDLRFIAELFNSASRSAKDFERRAFFVFSMYTRNLLMYVENFVKEKYAQRTKFLRKL